MGTRLLMCFGATVVLALGACRDDSSPIATSPTSSLATVSASTSYLIVAHGNRLPPGLAGRISAAGGTLTRELGQIGVAKATSAAPDFAARASRIPGIQAVARDPRVRWIDPNQRLRRFDGARSQFGVADQSIGDDETFFQFQWAPRAISAPQAWDAGARGTGVRVAVVDGGLNPLHIDLNGSVDVARSASMVEGFDFNEDVDPDDFSHATHVAGIIAARDNGLGTIGIAPGATIIGVKVLHEGNGDFGDVIAGIVYAATPITQGGAGAHIINLSLGAVFPLQGAEAAQLVSALGRATTYAYQQGVAVIAAAGNDAVDLDHTANVVSVPAQSPHAIAISATGPEGFAVGATNFDRPASYTNFGQSAIHFAAPGGDFSLFPNGIFVFDMVLSPATLTATTGYFFAAGTSMAAPHAAGVAALILEKNGGPMHPAHLEKALRASSDDLGKPGQDDFYGAGFVNALKAVQ